MALDLATVFVDKPYVLGSTRVLDIDVSSTSSKGVKTPEPLANDRIEIHIGRTFDDRDVKDRLIYTSLAGGAIVLSTTITGRMTWTIRRASLPVGDLKFRVWRVVNPGTSTEDSLILGKNDYPLRVVR